MSVLGVVAAGVTGFFTAWNPQAMMAAYSIASGVEATLNQPDNVGPRLDDLRTQLSTYGAPIPFEWGINRHAGTVMWPQTLDAVEHKHSESAKGGPDNVTYTYTLSCAVLVCEGPIASIRRIWANKKLVYDASGPSATQDPVIGSIRIHLGTETQDADPLIEATDGPSPAYRGSAYVVFEDYDVTEMAGRPPQWEFEVVGTGSEEATQLVTTFATDPFQGGDSMVYNPERNEIWNMANSSVAGVDRIDPDTGVSLGIIDTSSVAGGIESGIFGNPQYDPVNGFIYVLAYGPRVMLKFDAAAAVLVDSYAWAAGNLQYFAVSPVTGNVWGVALVGGIGRLQQRDGLTNAVLTDVVIPDNRLPHIVIDGAGDVWLQSYSWLKRYSGGFDFTYTDADAYNNAAETFTYDAGRNAIWFGARDISQYTTATITGISQGNPAVVDYTVASGPGFLTGQSIRIQSIAGMPQLLVDSGGYFQATVVDANTLTLGVDSSAYDAYTSGGAIVSNFGVVRELSIDTLSIVKTVQVAAGTNANAVNLLYDGVRNVVWALGTVTGTMIGIDTASGALVRWVTMPDAGGIFWTALAGDDIWVNDSSYETLYRIRFGGGFVAAPVTLATIVSDICVRANLSTDDIDVTQLTDPVDGYIVPRQMTARAAIEPLQQAFYFDAVESDDKIKFVKRGGAVAATIAQDERAAHEHGQAMPDALSIVRAFELELPFQCDVEYPDIDADHLIGNQYDRRITKDTKHKINLQLPIVMTAAKAKQVARVSLYQAWLNQSYRWTTTRKYAYLEPTDAVDLPTTAALYHARILSKKEQPNGVIEWEGRMEGLEVYTQSGADAAPTNYAPQTVFVADVTVLVLMDIPLLRDEDDNAGFYVAMGGTV